MMLHKPLVLISTIVLLFLSGCAPTLSPGQRASLDAAGIEMDRQLTPAGRLAATAALIYEDEGAFPTTQFGLLGSPQAATTGLRNMNLSALDVEPTADGLTLRYTLLPTQQDPTDRYGTIRIQSGDDAGQYGAQVELLRRDDPDHTGSPLPLAREGQIEVRRLSGHFHIDVATVRRQAEASQAGDLPLDDKPYRITFTPSPPTAVDFPRELREGYPVRIDN